MLGYDAPAAADAARRLPARDAPGARESSSASSTAATRTCSVVTWDGDEYQASVRRARRIGRRRPRRGDASSPRSTGARDRCSTRAAVPAASRSSSRVAASRSSASTSTRRCWRTRARDVRRGRVGARTISRRSTSARTFDVVVMAGNVPLFTPPGTHAAVVAGCARTRRRRVAPRRRLPARARLRPRGLRRTLRRRRPRARRALRDLGPGAVHDDGDYAVSVHRRM